MKLILATGSDSNYLNRISGCLKSIEANSSFDENYLVYLQKLDEYVAFVMPKVRTTFVNIDQIESLNKNNCIQHGEFMKAHYLESLHDEDVVVFIDGDVEVQRALNQKEESILRSLKDDDVYVGYNAGVNDTLNDEYFRLGPSGNVHEVFNVNIENLKVYNTGVLAMNKKTWLKLSKRYIELFPYIDVMFSHYAKQQWLISFIIVTQMKVIEMDYTVHNHTHHGIVPGSRKDADGKVYYGEDLVLFKHRWINE